MPKINQEEYEVLKGLDDKWKWIARDKSKNLFIFAEKPHKKVGMLFWDVPTYTGEFVDTLNSDLFHFIQWEDAEPYSIRELIEEYESEETEVKKELKEAILGIEVTQFDGQKADLEELVNPKQLENVISDWMPEVLSDEWIDENKKDSYVHYIGYYVPIGRLRDLLVPKQKHFLDTLEDGVYAVKDGRIERGNIATEYTNKETKYLSQELPVIPKFVANWIEEVKPDNSLRVAFEYIAQRKKDNHDDGLAFWVEEGNSETFARAWLDGYEVAEEREQKYRVIFPSADESGKGFNYLAKDFYHKELWVEDARTDGLAWEERSSFTEDEIRDLDKGDILFEHFAVKVEEMEE